MGCREERRKAGGPGVVVGTDSGKEQKTEAAGEAVRGQSY